jgi:hypothetical protein
MHKQLPQIAVASLADAEESGLAAGRILSRIRIGYNGAEYDRPELQWTQSSFVHPQMMVHDRFFYDPVAHRYTVDRYLKDVASDRTQKPKPLKTTTSTSSSTSQPRRAGRNDKGEYETRTEWHRVYTWRNLSKFAKTLQKGQLITLKVLCGTARSRMTLKAPGSNTASQRSMPSA